MVDKGSMLWTSIQVLTHKRNPMRERFVLSDSQTVLLRDGKKDLIMSIIDAERDGIEYYYDQTRAGRGRKGIIVYKVPCQVCGKIMERTNYGGNSTYICPKCRSKKKQHQKEVEQAWFDIIEEKGEARFDKALDKIEKQVKSFNEYERAAKIARKAQDKYGSIPEAMVAVELIRLGYSIIPQQKVGKYRVDFYVPKHKFVIEVDGEMYHKNTFKGEREARIQFALGLDVKIIHVPAELIVKDIQKLKKIIDSQLP